MGENAARPLTRDGFISLKYALEQFGQRAVARVIALGILRYDPTTVSLKVTEAALGRD